MPSQQKPFPPLQATIKVTRGNVCQKKLYRHLQSLSICHQALLLTRWCILDRQERHRSCRGYDDAAKSNNR